jgi:hypothetical protein
MNIRISILMAILTVYLFAGCKKENAPIAHLQDTIVENPKNPKYFLADTVSGVYLVSGTHDVIADNIQGDYEEFINNDTIIISKSHDSLIVFHSRPGIFCVTEGLPCKNTIRASNDYTFDGLDSVSANASLEVYFHSGDSIRIFSLNDSGCGGSQEYLLNGIRVH